MPFVIPSDETSIDKPFDSSEYKILIQAAQEMMPELYNALSPRTYPDMAGYYSPKILAASLADMAFGVNKNGLEQSPNAARIIVPSLGYLIDRKMPIMFLSPQFVEALKRTDFPTEINWEQMKLPYEAGLFVLPRNTLIHPKDGDCGFLFYSRLTKNQACYAPLKSMGTYPIHMANTTFNVCGLFPMPGFWYESCLTAEIKPTVKISNVFEGVEHLTATFQQKTVYDLDLTTDDDMIMSKAMSQLVFGTLLALTARPELLTEAKLVNIVRNKKNGHRTEFWSANIIGKYYKPKAIANAEPGTHASPRMHWRRGHFKQQHYGVGNAQIKTIWLEPQLVKAETT